MDADALRIIREMCWVVTILLNAHACASLHVVHTLAVLVYRLYNVYFNNERIQNELILSSLSALSEKEARSFAIAMVITALNLIQLSPKRETAIATMVLTKLATTKHFLGPLIAMALLRANLFEILARRLASASRMMPDCEVVMDYLVVPILRSSKMPVMLKLAHLRKSHLLDNYAHYHMRLAASNPGSAAELLHDAAMRIARSACWNPFMCTHVCAETDSAHFVIVKSLLVSLPIVEAHLVKVAAEEKELNKTEKELNKTEKELNKIEKELNKTDEGLNNTERGGEIAEQAEEVKKMECVKKMEDEVKPASDCECAGRCDTCEAHKTLYKHIDFVLDVDQMWGNASMVSVQKSEKSFNIESIKRLSRRLKRASAQVADWISSKLVDADFSDETSEDGVGDIDPNCRQQLKRSVDANNTIGGESLADIGREIGGEIAGEGFVEDLTFASALESIANNAVGGELSLEIGQEDVGQLTFIANNAVGGELLQKILREVAMEDVTTVAVAVS